MSPAFDFKAAGYILYSDGLHSPMNICRLKPTLTGLMTGQDLIEDLIDN